MTALSIDAVCPQCGGQTELRREGSTQGLFCTKCDWSVVTTVLPDIFRDTSSYEVRVISGDFKNDRQLKAVAQVTGGNFLASRKLLQQAGNFLVFTGAAPDVVAVRDVLSAAGLELTIEPPFPW